MFAFTLPCLNLRISVTVFSHSVVKRREAYYVAAPAGTFFSEKRVIKHKISVLILTTTVVETFHILRKIRRDI
jgi:hypothetical protein